MRTIAVAATATAALGTALIAGSVPAGAHGAARTPTVTARISKSRIKLSTSSVHAGLVRFEAVSTDRHYHLLQVARLRHGYTLQQAGSDLGKAFGGNVKAIRRVDRNVSFRGGAGAHRSGTPGTVVMDLTKGRYYVLDQNGNGVSALRVFGTEHSRPAVGHQGAITAHTYGFENTRLPSSGDIRVGNVSDQPHFVAMGHVKDGTTRRQVTAFIKSGARSQPSWLLHAGADSGVISPYRHEVMHYRLPAGEYLLACFWPDDDTGMPHFFMGMWKLVHIG